MVVSHCPQLYAIRKAYSQDSRVNIPAEADGTRPTLHVICGKTKRELAMPKSVAFEEHNINAILQPLNACHEVSCWSPAQSTFQPVDWLADTIKYAFS